MTICAEGSITTSMSLDDAKALVHTNLAAAGLKVDSDSDSDADALAGKGGKLLKYRLLGIWFMHTDELPSRVEVEFSETEAGTLVSAEIHDRQGVGIQLGQVLDPDKYEAAGQAAIAEAFKGLTS